MVKEIEMKVLECTCERCKRIWIVLDGKIPVSCRFCRNSYWNRPRLERKKKEQSGEGASRADAPAEA